jgi:hypothetical protein
MSHINVLALSRAAQRHNVTAARAPAGRRKPAKGVDSNAWVRHRGRLPVP